MLKGFVVYVASGCHNNVVKMYIMFMRVVMFVSCSTCSSPLFTLVVASLNLMCKKKKTFYGINWVMLAIVYAILMSKHQVQNTSIHYE